MTMAFQVVGGAIPALPIWLVLPSAQLFWPPAPSDTVLLHPQ